ncbi:predicted protein [Lichtheimia corymbifera JMRC:FSU:9682]|uniref:Uncharacterized protein n=1 Tax=Lichtheimia corymbifera JMRC:FSU:9682 TaxID=1263082 RepID=A0A068RXR0_9FUNG|nr:predicted protein [Lichtheimia corymbifera JMRC:FSU:9682]
MMIPTSCERLSSASTHHVNSTIALIRLSLTDWPSSWRVHPTTTTHTFRDTTPSSLVHLLYTTNVTAFIAAVVIGEFFTALPPYTCSNLSSSHFYETAVAALFTCSNFL